MKVLFAIPSDKLMINRFVTAVRAFFEKGFLPKGMNTMILALIPKITGTKRMKYYRPHLLLQRPLQSNLQDNRKSPKEAST